MNLLFLFSMLVIVNMSLGFRVESNLFKLLCIKVIFIYNINLLIDDWYCHFILKV